MKKTFKEACPSGSVELDYLYGLESDGGSDEGHNCIVLDSETYNDAIIDKTIATFKIASVINHYYGGVVSTHEVESDVVLWSVECDAKGYCYVIPAQTASVDKLLLFRTKDDAKDFLSYEENVQLVRDYFMIH